MRFDGWSLIYAVGVEAVLATAAVFGGPHGALGALPWLLNMPGILVIFGLGVERFFPARVALAVGIQVCLWYVGFAFVRRRRHTGARTA